jgi:hypothetical protein
MIRLMKPVAILIAFAAVIPATAGAEEPPVTYHYSDEWSLVSAPPPMGPYHPVNIDPRIPGPGTVETIPMLPPEQETGGAIAADAGATEEANSAVPDEQAEIAAEPVTRQQPSENTGAATEPEIAEGVPGNAPAAGLPVIVDDSASAVDAAAATAHDPSNDAADAGYTQGWSQPAPPPPVMGNRMPPPAYPAYPYPSQRYPYQSMYRGSPNGPPPGYYNPPGGYAEPEVPPPPVYDRSNGRVPYQGGGW